MENYKQGLSTTIIVGSVFALNSITNGARPDGSSNNSFPSGHTFIAFAGAEFLYQEYKDQSIWYGVAGYVVAAGPEYFECTTTGTGLQMWQLVQELEL